ncbi:uncharacterized protein [Antedon mediterranea]
MVRKPAMQYSNQITSNDEHIKQGSGKKILLDCGANMASTVELFRETYPQGKDFTIHSFEIDDRLAPYFSPYSNHYLHCPLGVADTDGNMTAFSESPWAPDKGENNGKDMQWGGGTLYVDKDELSNTNTGGRRKLSYRKKIPTVDLSKWIQKNTQREDYVVFKLDVEGAEFKILEKMLKDGTFEWIDKYYGEYHISQPVGIDKVERLKIIKDVKTNGKAMLDWAGEQRDYEDFSTIHPSMIPETVVGSAGAIYTKCTKPMYTALVLKIGMSRKQAVKVISTLSSYRIVIPVTLFVYSEFVEEWPDLVKEWTKVYSIGLRGNHPYPTGHFEKMSQNWIREAVVSSEMRLHEHGIIPIYYLHTFRTDGKTNSVLKERGFRIVKAKSSFPPESKPLLTVENYYNYRDVERVPKALRIIYGQLKKNNGGVLSLDTDLPDTSMILVFLLDYLVEKSGFTPVSLGSCIS